MAGPTAAGCRSHHPRADHAGAGGALPRPPGRRRSGGRLSTLGAGARAREPDRARGLRRAPFARRGTGRRWPISLEPPYERARVAGAPLEELLPRLEEIASVTEKQLGIPERALAAWQRAEERSPHLRPRARVAAHILLKAKSWDRLAALLEREAAPRKSDPNARMDTPPRGEAGERQARHRRLPEYLRADPHDAVSMRGRWSRFTSEKGTSPAWRTPCVYIELTGSKQERVAGDGLAYYDERTGDLVQGQWAANEILQAVPGVATPSPGWNGFWSAPGSRPTWCACWSCTPTTPPTRMKSFSSTAESRIFSSSIRGKLQDPRGRRRGWCPGLPEQLVDYVREQAQFVFLWELLQLGVGLAKRFPALHRVRQKARAGRLLIKVQAVGDLDRGAPQHLGVELVGAALDLAGDFAHERQQRVAVELDPVPAPASLANASYTPVSRSIRVPYTLKSYEGDVLGDKGMAGGGCPAKTATGAARPRGRGPTAGAEVANRGPKPAPGLGARRRGAGFRLESRARNGQGGPSPSTPSRRIPATRVSTAMDLLEYQGKQLFARHGLAVSPGKPAKTVEEAVAAANEIGYPVVVKAQVLIGGRGKAGGVKLADDGAQVREHAQGGLGMDIRGHTSCAPCGSSTPAISPASTTRRCCSTARPSSRW